MKIELELSATSIDSAIRALTEYQQSIDKKLNLLMQRISERIIAEAQQNFNSAVGATNINTADSAPPKVSVDWSVSKRNTYIVTAKDVSSGEPQIAFVEFGAGVFHNGSAGSSPHPLGTELGLTIGSYGYGRGTRRAWGYYDETGQLVITRGTPGQSPFYRAFLAAVAEIPQLAKEVFGQ